MKELTKEPRIEHKFAEDLVAQMLQRSGVSFVRQWGLPAGPKFDFVVNNGGRQIAIEVKYSERHSGVADLKKQWLNQRRRDTAMLDVLGPSLVVVTERGYKVFAEQSIAALLTPDNRTQIVTFRLS